MLPFGEKNADANAVLPMAYNAVHVWHEKAMERIQAFLSFCGNAFPW